MDILYTYGFLRSLLDFFLPRACIICGKVLFHDETLICEKCAGDIPHTYFWILRNNPMADRFNEMIQENIENVKGHEKYAFAAALFFYRPESDYREITRHIKYHGRTDVGVTFGIRLGEKLRSSRLYDDVDAVIPVPLHWLRRWKRGYNQAEIIASGVAQILNVPLRCDILERCRRTRTQTKLDIGEKAKNVRGAFVISNKCNGHQNDLKHLLLIDDVFTTGSTAYACFLALRSVFPPNIRISVATLAVVGD